VPIAAYVTSYARVSLHQHLCNAHPYYCDTDGFATEQSDLPVSNEVGDIKLEKTYPDAIFHAPKLYAIFEEGKDPIVRAKGFSMANLESANASEARSEQRERSPTGGLAPPLIGSVGDETVPESQEIHPDVDPKVAAFYNLIEGGHIVVGRMLRLRELYSKGILRPTEKRVVKAARFTALPKRLFRGDGSSRAWQVDELHLMHQVED